MKPSYFTYDDYFRGKVYFYKEGHRDWIPCKEVRKNRLKALGDAQALIKKLRHANQKEKEDAQNTGC